MSRRPSDLRSRILQALSGSGRGPLRPKELARVLRVPTEEYRRFRDTLRSLEREGRIYRVKGHRYGTPATMDLVAGALSLTRGGDAFLRPSAGGEDVFVPAADLAFAMDGDRVVVRIESRPPGRRPVGRVIKVLERAHGRIVGTLHRARRMTYVVPLDRRVSRDVLVAPGKEAGAREGDVVVVRMVSYGERGPAPEGEVDTVLGPLSDPGVDVLAIAHGYGLALEFPPAALRAAEEAAARPPSCPGRVDRTGLLLFTIDPSDAKDHDDALSWEPSSDGGSVVGVHIADVSYYVPVGGPVDQEALARGTSIYLVDRVVPMLPERLSGDACSLRPDVERAAVSLFLTLDRAGRLVERRYERSLVRSRHRLTYEEVQGVLDGTRSVAPATDTALRGLDDVARRVREHRVARGALDLDLPEARVILDDEGAPLDIQRVERLESHRLVEDFMILANEVVASDAEARNLPVLFRVHEAPVSERVEELSEFLTRLGHRLPSRKRLRPRDVQTLLGSVRGHVDEELVSTVVLRSLQRARYDAENLGHFGLASEAYLHFTSPIRRYPDLVVHRAVVRTLVEGLPPQAWDPEALAGVAEQASLREQAADDAERDSVALKKVEFMERLLGEEMDGRVSGVTAFGFFVTLDAYFVDGLVHVNSLRDDFYRLDEGAYCLQGVRGHRSYRLGDRVRVQVARVDKEERHIDFLLVRKLARGKV